MAWEPVSSLFYVPLNPRGQILVVCCPVGAHREGVISRWRDKACAIVGDSEAYLRDVVRDLLHNPQIRAVVFDGECCGREAYARFWEGETPEGWKIDGEHLSLVRQFVDLFEGELHFRTDQAPFWPGRIRYE